MKWESTLFDWSSKIEIHFFFRTVQSQFIDAALLQVHLHIYAIRINNWKITDSLFDSWIFFKSNITWARLFWITVRLIFKPTLGVWYGFYRTVQLIKVKYLVTYFQIQYCQQKSFKMKPRSNRRTSNRKELLNEWMNFERIGWVNDQFDSLLVTCVHLLA